MRLLIVSIICSSLFTISLQTINFVGEQLNEENEQTWSKQLMSDMNVGSQTEDEKTNNLLGKK